MYTHLYIEQAQKTDDKNGKTSSNQTVKPVSLLYSAFSSNKLTEH